MKKINLLIIILSITVLSGCVTGTRTLDLTSPNYEPGKTASGQVYIGVIEDKRIFEQSPRSPSTPSVKGNLASTPKEKLATLIGRQRNGYGAAMGDVALVEGSTVQSELRELLTEGLEMRGYTVVDDPSSPNRITVDIEQFWAWFSPGFVSVSFESSLQCFLNFENGSQETAISISGYGLNKGQVASDANWLLAYERAFADFLKNLDKALDAEGL